jgi:hypothetical protein
LFVRRCLETLPRQTTSEEVEEDVPQRFEIISTRLFCQMYGFSMYDKNSVKIKDIPRPR